jgi:hypothetical protein
MLLCCKTKGAQKVDFTLVEEVISPFQGAVKMSGTAIFIFRAEISAGGMEAQQLWPVHPAGPAE